MSLNATPPDNLAAVGPIHAVAVDDPDSGLLVISQHGGCKRGPDGDRVTAFMLALAALASRAIFAANGYNVERTLRVLDAWTAEYADDAAAAS
jgi:hypothetical protein